MLRWRLLSAAVILTILLGMLWLDFHFSGGHRGAWLAPLGLIFAALATGELLRMYRGGGHDPVAWTTIAGTLAVFAAACVPILWPDYPGDCPLGELGWPLAAAALAVVLVLVGEMSRYQGPGGVIVNVALSSFAVLYVGLLMSFLVALRRFQDNQWGMAALLSTIIVVKFSDAGAYAFGRLFGRHKMSPRLSPGKTIEGAVGGLVTACAVSWLVFQLLVPRLVDGSPLPATWWGPLVYAVLLTLGGMTGDLAESLVKRDLGQKDSSSWLPGLGGILDVIDSILVAAPVAYLCWAGGIVGPT